MFDPIEMARTTREVVCIMTRFSPPGNTQALRKRLRSINPAFADFEEEYEFLIYPAQ